MDKPQAYTDSPQHKLGGSHHLPPYSILNAWPWGLHQMSFGLRTPQVESFEIPKIEILTTLEGHNFFFRPSIEVRFTENL